MTSETQEARRARQGWKKNVNSDVAVKLSLLNNLGEVAKEWLLKQGKFILGSGNDCSIRVDLAGISEQNLLIVVGARQTYLRPLSSNVTKDGVLRKEVVIEDESDRFEIGGHRFSLARSIRRRAQSSTAPQQGRKSKLQFTMARPDALLRNKEMPASLFRGSNYSAPMDAPQQPTQQDAVARFDSDWVNELVQSAIEPLEQQIQSALSGPEPSYVRPGRRSATTNALEAVFGGKASDNAIVLPKEDLPSKLDELSTKQEEALTQLGSQIQDITKQLGDIEQMVTVDREQQAQRAKTDEERALAQNEAIGQLQNGMVSVSEAIKNLEAKEETTRKEDGEWRDEFQSQIGDLRNSVDTLVNSAERDKTQEAEKPPADDKEASWRNDVQNQIVGLRQSVEVLLENSHAKQISDANSEQVRLAEDTNWRNDVHSQISDLKQAITTLVETAAENQQNVQNDIGSRSDEDLEWKRDVQTQFSLIRNALEQVARNHSDDVSPLGAQSTSSDYSETIGIDQPSRAELEIAAAQTRHMQTAWAEDNAEPQEAAVQEQALTSGFGAAEEVDNSFGETEEALDWQNPKVELPAAVEPESTALEQPPWALQQPDVEPVHTEQPQEADPPAQEIPQPEAVVEESVEEPQPSNTEDEEFFFDASGPASEQFTPTTQPDAEQEFEAPPVEADEASLPEWWSDDSGNTADVGAPQANDDEFHYGAESTPLAAEQNDFSEADPSLQSQMFSMEALTAGDSHGEFERADPARELSEQLAEFQEPDDGIHEPEIEPVSLDQEQQSALHSRLDRLTPVRDDSEADHQGFSFEAFQTEESTPFQEEPSEEQEEALNSRLDKFALGGAPSSVEPEEASHDDAPFQGEQIEPLADQLAPQEEAVLAPVGAEEAPETAAAGDDDSVEDYMRKLLARMRGVPEEEVSMPETPAPAGSSAAAASPQLNAQSAVEAASPVPPATAVPSAEEEPFDMDSFVPRVAAPEQVQNLAAMRELANSSARTAIHKSTRKRHLSSIILKIVIAAVGFAVGGVLVAINGINMNVGLIATVAAFLVALIWGYDALSSLKPLVQNGLVLKPANNAPAKVEQEEE